jgi:antagonist of KipI
MALRVIKAGMLTTIQDRGRWGLQSRGVPVAGPMDPCSHRLANAIVRNCADAATLEVTLLGPELEFEDERVLAVAGAEFELTVDGRTAPHAAPFIVPAGATLRFGSRIRGARAYLAVAGGVAVPPTLGSRATHLISRMGGLDGRPLKAGDLVPLGERPAHAVLADRAVSAVTPLPDGHARIRLLPGPQVEYFVDDALETLQSGPYTVGGKSDRMGFRLEGPGLRHARGADIISDATPLGVLQVPASGQPILLMADRQTTGGYPKLATVISADIGVAGQLGPGDTISFVVCSLREAVAALIAQERVLMAFEDLDRPGRAHAS